jgi:hypothetical protein
MACTLTDRLYAWKEVVGNYRYHPHCEQSHLQLIIEG